MLYCAACNTIYPEGKKFCRTCGAALTEQPEPAGGTCRSCGAPLTSGKKFCRSCGAAVEAVSAGEASTSPTAPDVEPTAQTAAPKPAPAAREPAPPLRPPAPPRPTAAPELPVSARRAELRPLAPIPEPKNYVPYAVGGAAAVLVVAALGWWWLSGGTSSVSETPQAPSSLGSSETTGSANAALVQRAERGYLVTPRGSSAYDLYTETKARGLSSGDMEELRAKVLPRLKSAGDAALQQWHDQAQLAELDWIDLERLYQWAVDLDPANPALQARLEYSTGQRQFTQANYALAAQHYRKSTELAPAWALPVNGLGRVGVRTNDYASAEAYYRQATELEPDWIYPHLNLAGVHLRNRQFDQAIRHYELAARLAPEKASVHQALGGAYEQNRQYAQALGAYERALDLVERTPEEGVEPAELRQHIAAVRAKL